MNTVTDFYSKPSRMSSYSVYSKSKNQKGGLDNWVGRRTRAAQKSAAETVPLLLALASGFFRFKKAQRMANKMHKK